MRVKLRRHREAGFTLIEVLVALAVISISAVALISAAESTLRRVFDIEVRRAANWIADAAMVKFELGHSEGVDGEKTLYGTSFIVTASTEPLPSSGLEKLTLEVYIAGDDFGARNLVTRQVGFRLAQN